MRFSVGGLLPHELTPRLARLIPGVREPINVRFPQRQLGKHLLILSFSQFEPQQATALRPHLLLEDCPDRSPAPWNSRSPFLNRCSAFGTPFAGVGCFQGLERSRSCAGAVALRRPSRQRLLARADTLKRGEFIELADDAAPLCRTVRPVNQMTERSARVCDHDKHCALEHQADGDRR
jgi:hypothetical protein